MPAPPLANTFDGGTDTVAITVANSGGVSGDALSAVAGGASLTYSATHAHSGLLAMQVTQGATYANVAGTWSGYGVAGGADLWNRFYLWIPGIPAVNTPVIRWITAAGATSGQIKILTTGVLQGGNAATTAIAASLGTIAVATAQWVRIETRIRASTTIGEIEWWLFNSPESTVATETKASGASQVLGADTGGTNFGNPGTTGHINESWWYDDIAASSIAAIGPSGPLPQLIRPDADLATTGWSTVPLFSKVNDASDATVISATAA